MAYFRLKLAYLLKNSGQIFSLRSLKVKFQTKRQGKRRNDAVLNKEKQNKRKNWEEKEQKTKVS